MSVIPLILLSGVGTFARQQVADPTEFRKWDAAGTIGIFGSNKRDFIPSGSYYGDTLVLAWKADAGRYLTTHLKVDAGVMTANSRRFYVYPQFYSGQGVAYSSVKVRPTSATGALTYQFFENVFAHPYVSVGLGLTWLSEEREAYSFLSENIIDRIPAISSQTRLQASPFVAAGYKSYFNERAFMKSELLFAAGSHGFAHASIRVGFGVDF